MSKTRVGVLSDGVYDAWTALVQDSPYGSVYGLPAYLDVLCVAAGGAFRILGVYRGDELVGGVALYERDSAFGRYVSPRLLLYYNGPVLRRYDTKYPSERTSRQVEALGALAEALEGEGFGAIVLKARGTLTDVRPFQARGWSARPSYTYVVPLDDLGARWELVEQNLRRLIRRCERDGLVLTEDDDFDAFYRLHSLTLGRKGVGQYLPHAAFAQYFTRLRAQGLCRLYHARLPDGRAIASQLVLLGHAVTHSVSAAGDPDFNRTGAQAFLRWKVFEALSALGHSGNDLTDAALNPVTHFKAQLGGDLVPAFVVESPSRLPYQIGSAAGRLARRVRGLASGAVRRMISRRRE